MPKEIPVPYDLYDHYVRRMAVEIEHALPEPPDQVIVILTGGSFAAKILADHFCAALGTIAIQRYGKDRRPLPDAQIYVSPTITNTRPAFGRRLLIVDDLSDEGDTMHIALREVPTRIPTHIDCIHTAVAFRKTRSTFTPDFVAVQIGADDDGEWPWLLQPWDLMKRLFLQFSRVRR